MLILKIIVQTTKQYNKLFSWFRNVALQQIII